MLLNGWWLIALAALSALMLALASAYVEVPRYRTSTRLIVSPNASQINSGQFIYSIDTLDKRSIVTTYSEVLNSQRLFEETGTALGVSASELSQYNHSTVVIPEANILELYVDGPDPALTAQLSNNLAQRSIVYVHQAYQVYDLNVLDPAAVPGAAYSPKPVRDAGLATVLGMVLGAVLAVLQEQLKLPLEALRRRNTRDPVSLALNRRTFEQTLKEAMQTAGVASLGLIHLDGLSELMDSVPQPAIQRILRQGTNILRRELRGSDIVGRWNPTTFAILLVSTPEQAAARTFERIRDSLARPLDLGFDDELVRLTPFAGVAARSDTMSATELIEQAEAALKRAVRTGDSTGVSSERIELQNA